MTQEFDRELAEDEDVADVLFDRIAAGEPVDVEAELVGCPGSFYTKFSRLHHGLRTSGNGGHDEIDGTTHHQTAAY